MQSSSSPTTTTTASSAPTSTTPSATAPSLLLLDVRSELEVEMCSLPGSINVPIHHFSDGQSSHSGGDVQNRLQSILTNHSPASLIVICRRGNDSQLAVSHLRRHYPHLAARDVIGGLHAWTRQIDPNFPIY